MTLQNDTLVYDAGRIAYWQSDPAHDYNRELVAPDLNIMELIYRWIGKLLEILFGNRFAEQYTGPVLVLFFAAVVLLLIWFLYKKRPELFMRVRKNSLPYNIVEDTIYGVDFETEIDRALSNRDYKEAVRLLYLQTLKQLSDNGVIDWQLYKTPTEYIYEIKPENTRSVFRELTNSFLRVRYGNFEAEKTLFDTMRTLQDEVKKGGGQ